MVFEVLNFKSYTVVCNQKVLKDVSMTMEQCGIKANGTIHIIRRLKGVERADAH